MSVSPSSSAQRMSISVSLRQDNLMEDNIVCLCWLSSLNLQNLNELPWLSSHQTQFSLFEMAEDHNVFQTLDIPQHLSYHASQTSVKIALPLKTLCGTVSLVSSIIFQYSKQKYEMILWHNQVGNSFSGRIGQPSLSG